MESSDSVELCARCVHSRGAVPRVRSPCARRAPAVRLPCSSSVAPLLFRCGRLHRHRGSSLLSRRGRRLLCGIVRLRCGVWRALEAHDSREEAELGRDVSARVAAVDEQRRALAGTAPASVGRAARDGRGARGGVGGCCARGACCGCSASRFSPGRCCAGHRQQLLQRVVQLRRARVVLARLKQQL